jgi:hypothetical protein
VQEVKQLQQKKRDLEEIESMGTKIEREQSKILNMNKEIVNLQATLEKVRHSEEELRVMKAAMEEVGKEREDELRGVMISSTEITIERLLGKGG